MNNLKRYSFELLVTFKVHLLEISFVISCQRLRITIHIYSLKKILIDEVNLRIF